MLKERPDTRSDLQTHSPIPATSGKALGRRTPRPFLKWVGGKTQLLPQLTLEVARAGPIQRYHEPFLGGGALYFELSRRGQAHGAALSDSNVNLIEAYVGVRDELLAVEERLRWHAARHDSEHYYRIRAERSSHLAERAARLIYLNKTCFNGLYRENSRGDFNVPIGDYTNPTILDEENLTACSRHLSHADLSVARFEEVVNRARAGDFVYFDPPYVPVSRTSSFTGYGPSGFSALDQHRLAAVFQDLSAMGVKAMLSNSYADMVLELYGGYRIVTVHATRAINSNAERRGKVREVIVCNF